MTIKLPQRYAHGEDERGQVLVIFAAAFVVIIMMLALLFDSARGVVLRRQVQDASDAASLAAANVIQGTTVQGVAKKGCSATAGPPPGAPQSWVVAAAKASVAQNLPGFDLTKVVVTCPGPDNWAVKVTMGENSPTFFGSIFGTGPLSVSTHSVAVNGSSIQSQFSVVLLDPAHCGANCSPWLSPPPPPEVWPTNYDGCPSFGLNGTITAQFDSAIYVNSHCDAAHNGAFATKGGSANLTFGNGSAIHLVGEYKPQALVVTPAPLEHQGPHKDPLSGLVAPPVSTIKVRENSKLTLIGPATKASDCTSKGLTYSAPGCVLEPGVYVGGIQLKSGAVIYLHPGIYVLKDGGLDLSTGQGELYTIDKTATGATQANWATNCKPSTDTNHTCGVLIYKTTVSSIDTIGIGAGAVFMARSFDPDADTTLTTANVSCTACKDETYRHLLIWQDASPNASKTYNQPPITLQGGGGVTMSGAVYAPYAKVTLHGNSGGSGGVADLTLQFICWDLDLSGNSSFHFIFNANEFPTNLDYGLTQ